MICYCEFLLSLLKPVLVLSSCFSSVRVTGIIESLVAVWFFVLYCIANCSVQRIQSIMLVMISLVLWSSRKGTDCSVGSARMTKYRWHCIALHKCCMVVLPKCSSLTVQHWMLFLPLEWILFCFECSKCFAFPAVTFVVHWYLDARLRFSE